MDSHVEFRSKLDLPFPLLADEGGQIRKEWGVPKDLLGLLEGRQTYVIGEQRTIIQSLCRHEQRFAMHSDQLTSTAGVLSGLAAFFCEPYLVQTS